VFDAIKALLFDRGHQLAILHQAGGRITVEGVNTENIHNV
jgi:hypothetical protein